jgi:phosphoribosyl 1,2-cyclic phosphodiesterase
MKFASLGSGSEGNSLLISAESGSQRSIVMLDCGFGLKEVVRRLARLHLAPQQLSGVVVTHEHSDHIGGVFKLARHYSLPVWLTHGTFEGASRDEMAGVDIRICRDGESFAIGDIEMTPYTVPHDAREPVQYLATDGQRKLGVLTDVGQSTPHLLAALAACDALLLEFNHDSEMLARSAYPAWLKSRIAGPLGHLSNAASAEILASLDRSRLRTLVAAHLSQKNNRPSLAQEAIAGVVGDAGMAVVIAEQEQGFDWIAC